VYVPSVKAVLLGATPFASFQALVAAATTALLVTVAPDTTSTSALFASLIAVARVSRAAPPIAAVSASPTISTAVIAVSLTVRVTVTSPPKPVAVAVYVPAV
jgi:hypothetical protein